MKLEQLYIFDQIAKSKSIRSASENLFFTPQHLSKEIIALEKELQVKLFERDHSGIRLTEEGKLAQPYISAVLHDIDALKRQFSVDISYAETDKLPVNIATVPVLEPYASFVMRDLFSQFPYATLNEKQTAREHLSNSILTGEDLMDDIVLFNLTPNKTKQIHRRTKELYHCYFMYQDQLFLQVPRSSEYSNLKTIPLSLLAELPMMLFNPTSNRPTEFEMYLAKAGCKLKNVSYNSNLENCTRIALSTGKYSLVGYPSAEAHPLPNCNYIPVEGNITMNHFLMVKKKPQNPRAVKAFQNAFDDLFNLKQLF